MQPKAKPLSEKFLYLGDSARRMLVTHCAKKLTDEDWIRISQSVRNKDMNELCGVLDVFLEHVFNALPFATTKELNNAPNLIRK